MQSTGPSPLAVSVVLPTYNEAESLPVIIPRIAETLREAGIDGEIIVVDDNSPDGTADVARKLSEAWPVRVNQRTNERGLATAVLTGFSMSEAEVVVVMDADGSHPVSALPNMIGIIQADKADVVVGSRHVPGGGSKDWPLFSQFKSKLAATLSLGVTTMTDPTTGFMAARRTLLTELKLDPVGWKIVLEIVVKAAPVRIAEVPIVFVDRELGVSKQSLGVFFQYLSHLLKLYSFRYPSLAELVSFCVIGVVGLSIDLATVIATKELFGLDTRLCAVFGFIVAVTSNFFLNRRFTFAHARELPLLFSYVTYVGTNLAGLALRMIAIQSLIVIAGIDHGRGYVITNLIGIALATLLNFVGAKYFAFDPERVKETVEEPRGLPRTTSIPPSVRSWGTAALFVLTAAYAFATTVPSAELMQPEEGVNVTMARNIQHSREFFVRPSVFPGGRSDWLQEDLPALGNLPIYPALLALMPKLSGFSGMALLSFIALVITVLSTARLVALVDTRAGLYTGILMSCSPAFLQAFRRVEFEPVLTAFCAAGLFFFVRGAWYRHRAVCFIGGLLLGCGFLTKMWLMVPYAFALIAFCVIEAAKVRNTGTSAGLRRSVAVGALGFVLTASAHLIFVAVFSREDLPEWLSNVYLGIFSGQGVTGGKLSAIAQYAKRERPTLYYPLVLYRDHFFLVPLALFGLDELLRAPKPRTSRLLAMILGALVAVVALSVPAYKEARYALAVVPFLYALTGLCLAAFARAPGKLRPAATAVVRVVMVLAVLSSVTVTLLYYAVGVSTAFGSQYLIAHASGTLLCILLGELWMRTRFVTRELAVLSFVGLCGFAVLQPRLRDEPPPYRAIANVIAPYVANATPGYPSFLARDHNVLQGYLDRDGIGTGELDTATEALPTSTSKLNAFVIATGDGDLATKRVVAWLEGQAREVTGELNAALGSPQTGFRIFVRDPLGSTMIPTTRP